MKRQNRFIGTLLAGCMLMSMSGIAHAAEMTESPISENAGTTMTCQVVVGTFGSGTQDVYFVDVPVPENATEAEEHELVAAAAQSVSGMATPRFGYAGRDLLSHEGPWNLAPAGGALRVGGGTLTDDYDILYVQFDNVSVYNDATAINVRVENDRFANSKVYESGTIRLGDAATTIFMIAGEFYGDGRLYLRSTDTLDIFASTNGSYGGVNVGDVYVSVGSPASN